MEVDLNEPDRAKADAQIEADVRAVACEYGHRGLSIRAPVTFRMVSVRRLAALPRLCVRRRTDAVRASVQVGGRWDEHPGVVVFPRSNCVTVRITSLKMFLGQSVEWSGTRNAVVRA